MRRLLKLSALALAALTAPLAAKAPYYYYSYNTYYPTPPARTAATPYLSRVAQAERAAIAAYGPFRVLDDRTAALIGVTDGRTPAAFERMLRDFPRIATLRFVECPGTRDDRANLALGRMIRAAGIAAVVPANGSVRSGAVELALAGTTLTIDDHSQFAVHAWLDEDGYGANDYAADAPEHRKYLSYYRDMGMAADQAVSFYAMTNATP
ncbi:MAG TPA: alpha/beta hydrolase, partial [Croceibacterium sp.]